MLTKVDWLSWSVKFEAGEGRGVNETARLAIEALDALDPELGARLFGYSDYTAGKGRAPYSHSFSWHNNGLTLFVHPNLPHALFEMSGKGCDIILQEDWFWSILEPIRERLTRLDVACDMMCEVRPLEFTTQRDTGRFKAHSEVVSESGETNYVGSRTSNRYARVYRYNPPHERAHFLRCEYVVKAEDAKATAFAIINDGLESVALALGEKFGWQHPVWEVSAHTPAELQAYRPDRREGKTLFWLADTVAPLLVRLHREGTLELGQWFRDYIEANLTPDEQERFNAGRT
jgi:hypothetical protein